MTIPTIHTLNPAYTVVERLGGKSTVAQTLGLSKAQMTRWCSPTDAGGTGGVIPQKYWGTLLDMAKQQRVRLTLKELAAIEA
jgi:hypothetical protein